MLCLSLGLLSKSQDIENTTQFCLNLLESSVLGREDTYDVILNKIVKIQDYFGKTSNFRWKL